MFSQGSVRVRGRVTLVRRSLVSIKRSSGATPGVRSTGCPSGLSTPFLTLNLPWLFFYGGISGAAPATPGMSSVAVTAVWDSRDACLPPAALSSGQRGECARSLLAAWASSTHL